MKSPHEIALAIAKLIRESLYHDDGSLRPCLGTELNPQWVSARANNIATAICGEYDVRPNAISGEIETERCNLTDCDCYLDKGHDGPCLPYPF